MTKKNEPMIHPIERAKVYSLRGVPFVPHYTTKDTYVSPGDNKTRREYTEKRLILLGAVPERMDLWPRKYDQHAEAA